jgi:hypothetical protein
MGLFGAVSPAFAGKAAPAPVSSISGSAENARSIELKWNYAGSGTSFQISRKVGKGNYEALTHYSIPLTPRETSFTYTDTTVEPGNSYQYEIAAVLSEVLSANTSSKTISTPPVPAAATISKLKVVGEHEIDLQWESNWSAHSSLPAPTGFTIERMSPGGIRLYPVTNVSGSTFTYKDVGIAQGSTYTYAVLAYDANGVALTAASESATTEGTYVIPKAPEGADPEINALEIKNGWTVFPSNYEYQLYVDSVTGKDTNSGTDPNHPIKTITKLLTLMTPKIQDNRTMKVYLKRGASWGGTVGKPVLLEIQNSGTANYPVLFSGEWGEPSAPRPQLKDGIRVRVGNSHLAFSSLEIGPGGGQTTGLEISVADGTDYLVEDCKIDGFYQNFQAGGSEFHPITNIRVRRSQILGAIGSGPAVGLGGSDILGMLIDETVFDLNGLPAGSNAKETALTTNSVVPYGNIFAHDIYFVVLSQDQSVTDVRMKNNLFSRTLQSIKGPATGVLDNNLFYNFGAAGFMGPHGVTISNNVFQHGSSGPTISVDNAQYPNTDPLKIAEVYGNLYQDLFGASALDPGFSTTLGGNIDFDANVFDDINNSPYTTSTDGTVIVLDNSDSKLTPTRYKERSFLLTEAVPGIARKASATIHSTTRIQTRRLFVTLIRPETTSFIPLPNLSVNMRRPEPFTARRKMSFSVPRSNSTAIRASTPFNTRRKQN